MALKIERLPRSSGQGYVTRATATRSRSGEFYCLVEISGCPGRKFLWTPRSESPVSEAAILGRKVGWETKTITEVCGVNKRTHISARAFSL